MTTTKFLFEHIVDVSAGETFCALCGHVLRKRVYTDTRTGKKYCSRAHSALAERDMRLRSEKKWLGYFRIPLQMS